MAKFDDYKDIAVEVNDFVGLVEIRRPPFNFFDQDLIAEIADAFDELDATDACRAIVLASEGKAFCAGADFSAGGDFSERDQERGADDGGPPLRVNHLYLEALRLFCTTKPIVGAIHGAAVGGGLGLALVADLRVTCPEARFCANFTRLGFHPGFGLTTTLPAVVGAGNAALMFYTSRRIKGTEAHAMGLAEVLVAQDEVRGAALALAAEIAENAPLGVISTRETIRLGFAERVAAATERELAEQTRLRKTEDFAEGVKAMGERRVPKFAAR